MIKDDIYFMNEALKEAKKAFALDEVPIGCVIVLDGKIIARGHNLRETKKSAIAHAEINAITKANKKLDNWRLNDACLYVTLEPCPMCAGAMFQSRIGRIVFGAYDEKYGSTGGVFNLFDINTLNHKPIVIGGVLADKSRELLQSFFKNKRK